MAGLTPEVARADWTTALGPVTVWRMPMQVDVAGYRAALVLPEPWWTLAATLAPARRHGWLMARAALCEAWAAAARPTLHDLITDPRGAPRTRPEWPVSLSHKADAGAAVVGEAFEVGVGVDLEHASGPRLDVSARICTDLELRDLPSEPVARRAALGLRFCLKEAVYKAIAPTVARYIGFREVALEPIDDRARDGQLRARGLAPDLHGFEVHLAWRREAEFVVARAHAHRR